MRKGDTMRKEPEIATTTKGGPNVHMPWCNQNHGPEISCARHLTNQPNPKDDRAGPKEHTPGPWVWVPRGGKSETLKVERNWIDLQRQDENGTFVMVLPGGATLAPTGRNGELMEDFWPDHPNARLIAAAPDLLLALKTTVDALRRAKGRIPQAAFLALDRAEGGWLE